MSCLHLSVPMGCLLRQSVVTLRAGSQVLPSAHPGSYMSWVPAVLALSPVLVASCPTPLLQKSPLPCGQPPPALPTTRDLIAA